MTKTEQEIEKIARPVVEKLGYVLYDVEYIKEGQEWFLRIYIDNESGIDIDDCEKVSNELSKELDEKDPINIQYFLEVSSCGLERHLRSKEHFEKAIEKEIEIKLYKPLNRKKEIMGTVNIVNDNSIVININEKDFIEIKFIDIASAKILYNWEEDGK